MAKQLKDNSHFAKSKQVEKKLTVILDPAHGADTPGKCSPDGRHREYKWSRDRCYEIADLLKDLGYTVVYSNEGENEIGLTARKNNADKAEGKYKLLISPHNNAAGMGDKWLNAHGWSVYTTPGKTRSDDFAVMLKDCLMSDFPELCDTMRGLKEANFTVLTGHDYWAVLIEWMFQDNKDDLLIIEDEDYNARLVASIVDAVEIFESTLK